MHLKIYIDNDDIYHTAELPMTRYTPEKIENLCVLLGTQGYYNVQEQRYYPPSRIYKVEVGT